MSSKYEGHTPGPWKWDEEWGDLLPPDDPASDRLNIAVVETDRWFYGPDNLADRALIADSPMLLRQRDELAEALREIVIAPSIAAKIARDALAKLERGGS